MKYVKWFLCITVVLFAGYGVKSFFFPKKPGHHVDHGFVMEDLPDTVLNPNAEEGGPSALFSEVKFGESSSDATSSVLFNGGEAPTYGGGPASSAPPFIPTTAATPAPPFGNAAQALPAPAVASQYQATEAPHFDAGGSIDSLPPSPFGNAGTVPAVQEAPGFPTPLPMMEAPVQQGLPTPSAATTPESPWDSPSATPVTPGPYAAQETPRPFEGGPIGQNSVTAEPVGQESTPVPEHQTWDGPSSPLNSNTLALLPPVVDDPATAEPKSVDAPLAEPSADKGVSAAPKPLKALPPVTGDGPSLTYRAANPIRTEPATSAPAVAAQAASQAVFSRADSPSASPIVSAESLRQEREIDHILLSRDNFDAPVQSPQTSQKPKQPAPPITLVEFGSSSVLPTIPEAAEAPTSPATAPETLSVAVSESPEPAAITAPAAIIANAVPLVETPPRMPVTPFPVAPGTQGIQEGIPGAEFTEPRHSAPEVPATISATGNTATSTTVTASPATVSETIPTPAGPSPKSSRPEGSPQASPNLRESVVRYVQNQCSLIDTGTNQAVCEGFDWLSQLYDHKDLNVDERAYMAPILDQLAHDVIFSSAHVLEPAYQVKAFDTIESVARQFDLNPETLMRINGITQPGPLTPGSTLKVVRGPFDVRISLRRGELQIILGGLYAGSCPVAVSEALHDQDGEYLIQEKRVVGVDDQARWIGLGGGKGITTATRLDQANPNPLVLVRPKEMIELFDLLGEKSTITIVK